MATYGDMMTLVLCFFVLLYSFSTIDAEKLRQFAQSFTGGEASIVEFQNPNGITGILGNGIIEYPIPSDAVDIQDEADAEKQQMINAYIEQLKNYAGEFPTYFAEEYGEQTITVTVEGAVIIIELPGDFLFDKGQDSIKPQFMPVLGDISDLITANMNLYPNSTIVVEGHTDTTPMRSVRFPDNWALSSGRAEAVVRELMRRTGLDGSYFKASGRAEFQPRAENDTEEGRALNRRVVIYIEQNAGLTR